MWLLSSCWPVFDFEKLKLLKIFFSSLLRMLLWPTHYRNCCSSFIFKTHLPSLVSHFIGNDLVRLSIVVFTCLGMMDAVLFLSSVPFAQKLSGKGNPLLWWGRWLYPKGKYLHNTQAPWTVIVAQTLHPHILGFTLMSWFYLQVSSRYCVPVFVSLYVAKNVKKTDSINLTNLWITIFFCIFFPVSNLSSSISSVHTK